MFYLSGFCRKIELVIIKKWAKTFQRAFAIFLLSVLFSFQIAGFAKADFRVCNETQRSVGVALGYRTPSGWVSEGWWVIPTTECKTLIDGPLSSRFYYFYAEDAQKKGYWPGSVAMCVQDSQFMIEGVHDCFARGFQKVEFKEIDTGGQTSWTIQLTDASWSANPPPQSPIVPRALSRLSRGSTLLGVPSP
ncbi:hypothetical protein BAnh1_11600 [Bartonella australis AUST/NH1]|uniref:Uncharacterized protein n=1 Tax=Bartonella australis (strain Aust/NH1) TaxID=1094489 RepID=M1NUU4_BARAA|nr:DUF1036 domain-containing protein [Bartonella australis]AGF75028.1 hypothetical protein BAnh1_11600 [Bartonella australis AUST/NH1]